jgi:sensor histidine kinase regulating citrate/malate metabolism
MDDLLANLRAGPSGKAQQDRALMHRAAHEIQRLQAQLQDARNESIKLRRQADEYCGKEPVGDPDHGWGD